MEISISIAIVENITEFHENLIDNNGICASNSTTDYELKGNNITLSKVYHHLMI
jgi:hypothetical protein